MIKKIIFITVLFILSDYIYGQYKIPASVLGNGGGFISSSKFQINSTGGQTSIGFTEAGNFKNQVGFWRAAQILTPVEELQDIIPKEYGLEKNYPNPFNPSTTISYQMPYQDYVSLKVFDVLGNEVADILHEIKPAGLHEIDFDASKYVSGIYIYKMMIGGNAQTKRMIFLK